MGQRGVVGSVGGGPMGPCGRRVGPADRHSRGSTYVRVPDSRVGGLHGRDAARRGAVGELQEWMNSAEVGALAVRCTVVRSGCEFPAVSVGESDSILCVEL